MRIGHGFDAHRLVEGRKLILGGVEILYELGLAGHSDTDEQYRGADSLKLLERVMELVRAKRMRLGNADVTVVCQRPKLAPYLATMQENIAAVCGASPGQINIKATTTEKMGYTGRGEGITAHAVVLLTGTE